MSQAGFCWSSKYRVLFCLFYFGGTFSCIQELLLVLCSEIIPGEFGGPNEGLGFKASTKQAPYLLYLPSSIISLN